MPTAAAVQTKPQEKQQAELDRLGEDFFNLAEEQLAKMEPDKRETVIASIHATAETLRAAK
jgi:hypothetical protein